MELGKNMQGKTHSVKRRRERWKSKLVWNDKGEQKDDGEKDISQTLLCSFSGNSGVNGQTWYYKSV